MLLDWPATTARAWRARRAAGARVIVVDGVPVLYVERSGRRVWSFVSDGVASDADRIVVAARALGRPGPRFPRKGLRVEEIDGEAAARSPLAAGFLRGGFRAAYRGLELDRPLGAATPNDAGEAGSDSGSAS